MNSESWRLRYAGKDFALGQEPKGIVLDDIEAVNIDRPVDFDFAEFLFNKGSLNQYLPKDCVCVE